MLIYVLDLFDRGRGAEGPKAPPPLESATDYWVSSLVVANDEYFLKKMIYV
jgi:hypothetical protein